MLAGAAVGRAAAQVARSDSQHETQSDLNADASSEAEAAQEKMERIYQNLLRSVNLDGVTKEKLIASQSAWTAYRNAQMGVLYAHYHDKTPGGGAYGTSSPMCFSIDEAHFFDARAKELESMQHPIEGDVCSFVGSIIN
jgi:uncharacterized protein YecT (DUF1311 family)